jgi:hypothetical protein
MIETGAGEHVAGSHSSERNDAEAEEERAAVSGQARTRVCRREIQKSDENSERFEYVPRGRSTGNRELAACRRDPAKDDAGRIEEDYR